MITVRKFSSRMEAELARGLLEANGVRSLVHADDQGGMAPSMAFITGAELKVADEDFKKAVAILSAEPETD